MIQNALHGEICSSLCLWDHGSPEASTNGADLRFDDGMVNLGTGIDSWWGPLKTTWRYGATLPLEYSSQSYFHLLVGKVPLSWSTKKSWDESCCFDRSFRVESKWRIGIFILRNALELHNLLHRNYIGTIHLHESLPTRSQPTMAAEIREPALMTPKLTMMPMSYHYACALVSPSLTTDATF